MELKQAITFRYSCRKYKDQPVPDDLLQNIFDTARLAPSASNRQEWRFVVVTDPDKRQELVDKADGPDWWRTAPVIIACCAETNNHVMKCRQQCYPIDVSIIIDHITLLATEAGLATCWIGAFDEDGAKDACGLPEHIRVVELLILGYPADAAKQKKRLSLKDIIYRDTWGKAF